MWLLFLVSIWLYVRGNCGNDNRVQQDMGRLARTINDDPDSFVGCAPCRVGR